MTDSTYFAVGVGVFIVAAAIQLGLYQWLLRAPLQSTGLDQARPAFRRWILAAVAWQGLVIIAAGLYVFVVMRAHPPGVAWVAPALGVLLGTGLPLQLVASSALRAGFRAPR